MKQRIPRIPVVATIAFVLLVAIVILWVRSPRHADLLMFYTPAGHLDGIASDRTGLLLCATEIPFGSEMRLSAGTMSTSPDDFAAVHDLLFEAANEKGHFLGFHVASGTIPPWGWRFNSLIVPYWALLIPLAILPLTGFRRVIVRRRRKRRLQCLGCGYDLRQSPDRCPECGRAARGAAADSSKERARNIFVRGIVATCLVAAIATAAAVLLARGARGMARGTMGSPELAILDRRFSELHVRGRRLDEFIPRLARHAGAKVAVDWEGLAFSEEQRAIPVNLDLHAVKLAAVLDTIRDDVGWSDDDIWAEPGSVHWGLGTDSPVFVRSYPVGDLLAAAKSTIQQPPDNALEDNEPPIISSTFTTSRFDLSEAGGVLCRLIENIIRVDERRDNGGPNRDLQVIGDRLWVLQTQEGHAAVRMLLSALRHPARPGAMPDPLPADRYANLDQPIRELNLDQTTLESAIDAVRDATHANIVVCWRDLEAAGFGRNQPVGLHLRNVTLGAALGAILKSFAHDFATMCTVRDGIILVGTQDHLYSRSIVVRAYDITDLLSRFYAQHPPTPLPPYGDPAYDRWQQATGSITKHMEDLVDTDSWQDNGGAWCSIRPFARMLVIAQTPAAHRKVAEVLRELRAGGQGATTMPAGERKPWP